MFKKLLCKHYYMLVTNKYPDLSAGVCTYNSVLICGKCSKKKIVPQYKADVIIARQGVMGKYKEEHDES